MKELDRKIQDSIWEAPPASHTTQVEMVRHEPERVPARPGTVQFPFRIRRAYNPK